MLIGAYGTFWDRSLVDWTARNWRLLGRQGRRRPALRVADFRRARGVYALYGDTGIYYVGLAIAGGGIGRRLRDHTRDNHEREWSRFSWFSFDDLSDVVVDDEGLLTMEQWDSVTVEDKIVIRELEALLIAVTSPPGNTQRMQFQHGSQWFQVAEKQPVVETFSDLRQLSPR